ncbi:hypothetical protein HDV63DRAFT_288244 [Trichoderma sp. SZMC 28014]
MELQVPISSRADPLEGVKLDLIRHCSPLLDPIGGCNVAAIRQRSKLWTSMPKKEEKRVRRNSYGSRGCISRNMCYSISRRAVLFITASAAVRCRKRRRALDSKTDSSCLAVLERPPDCSHLRHGESVYPRRAVAWLEVNGGGGV